MTNFVLVPLMLVARGFQADSSIQQGGSWSNMPSYYSGDDYPADAARKHEQGTVIYHIVVGTDGRVHSCNIVESSGSKSLDEATCRIASERLRFAPARNNLGQAMEDEFTLRLTWKL